MTKSDKRHWAIALVYGGLLLLSMAVLWERAPEPPSGIASSAVVLCPVLVTPPLVVYLLVQMAFRRVSPACAIGTIAFVVVVSLYCFSVAMHI
ncbi:MAG: hypothetical protein ACYS7Y_31860 [Planctomycetota bacterium]|jgi:hypothetical protein